MGADSFLTILETGHAQTKVTGSRFIGSAHSLKALDLLDPLLEAERKQYYDATHRCFAARTGVAGDLKEKSSDAGEPHGTAGQPILREIQKRDVTDCAVIVIRYFGGTKLGTGNLARAYAECAAAALDNASIIKREILTVLHVDCSYDDRGIVYHLAGQYDAVIEPREVAEHASFSVRVQKRKAESLRKKLTDDSAGRIQVIEAGQWIS